MAQNSKIEWTHHTCNLWWGCTKVHEGCDNCYAETLSNRWGFHVWGNDMPRRAIKNWFNDLNKYQAIAKAAGEMQRVFVGSMMDIFEKPMPMVNHEGKTLLGNTGHVRDEFFSWIDNGAWPNLMFLLLTKRPSNINKYIPEGWKTNPPANVMFGTSPVNNDTADTLITQLLRVNGKRFLSIEPQLDKVDLDQVNIFFDKSVTHNVLTGIPYDWDYDDELPENRMDRTIDWVIQGGESGHHRRPFNLDWAYSMRDQCKAAGVPYFFKQIDKVKVIPQDLLIREFPNI